jgi:hypothetical protein
LATLECLLRRPLLRFPTNVLRPTRKRCNRFRSMNTCDLYFAEPEVVIQAQRPRPAGDGTYAAQQCNARDAQALISNPKNINNSREVSRGVHRPPIAGCECRATSTREKESLMTMEILIRRPDRQERRIGGEAAWRPRFLIGRCRSIEGTGGRLVFSLSLFALAKRS